MARQRFRTVFGESPDLVGQALEILEAAPAVEDGEVHRTLTPAQSGALHRALLRAEAKVLHGDADRLGRRQRLARDDGDRPFVALLLVMQRAREVQRS